MNIVQLRTRTVRRAIRHVALAAGTAGTAALALWGAGPVSATVPPTSAGPAVTDTFSYVGPHAQTTVVPHGVGSAEVRVTGAMGGRTCLGEGRPCPTAGGDGARVSGTIGVHPGQVLTIRVGGYGGNAHDNLNPGPGGWGPTGNGGRGGGAYGFFASVDGAGGGGASSLQIADCDGCAETTVAVAGGDGSAGETRSGNPSGAHTAWMLPP